MQKLPAHGLSKSLPFFARATSCEHSVERRLPLVSYVPISGTKELASRIPSIVWHTRSDTFVLIPLLELTRAVAQTVPDLFKHYHCSRFSISRSNPLNDGTVKEHNLNPFDFWKEANYANKIDCKRSGKSHEAPMKLVPCGSRSAHTVKDGS